MGRQGGCRRGTGVTRKKRGAATFRGVAVFLGQPLTMKITTTLSFLAALAAALFAPIGLELAGTLVLATGLAAILSLDYARRVRLPNYGLRPVALAAKAAAPAALRLAA